MVDKDLKVAAKVGGGGDRGEILAVWEPADSLCLIREGSQWAINEFILVMSSS